MLIVAVIIASSKGHVHVSSIENDINERKQYITTPRHSTVPAYGKPRKGVPSASKAIGTRTNSNRRLKVWTDQRSKYGGQ